MTDTSDGTSFIPSPSSSRLHGVATEWGALDSGVITDALGRATADRLFSCCLRIASSLDGEEHLSRQCDAVRSAQPDAVAH